MNVKLLASINKLRENAEFGVNREDSGSRYTQSTPIEEFATGLPVPPPRPTSDGTNNVYVISCYKTVITGGNC